MASAFASAFLGPWTAGFAKRGSVFWPPFWARVRKSYVAGVDSGATERTPFFFPRRFFCPFPSPQLVRLCALTAALAQASGPVVSGAESPADFIAKLKKKFDLV